MTEKELGKALLNLDMAPPAPDARQLSRKIVERDRWRVRLLAGLATLFWVVAAGGVVSLVTLYRVFLAPRLRAYAAGRAQLENDWDAWALVGEWAAWSIVACVLALLFGAVCTVLLILLSRRATLRQINANLVEISEQLKRLGQTSPSGPVGPPGGLLTRSLP